jgi:hypothetical protein
MCELSQTVFSKCPCKIPGETEFCEAYHEGKDCQKTMKTLVGGSGCRMHLDERNAKNKELKANALKVKRDADRQAWLEEFRKNGGGGGAGSSGVAQ